MTTVLAESDCSTAAVVENGSRGGWDGQRWPARPVADDWPATRYRRTEAWARVTSGPFVLDDEHTQSDRKRGLRLLFDWLETHPGDTWQQRWHATGVETAGPDWRQLPGMWLDGRYPDSKYRRDVLCNAVATVIAADLVRPSPAWLLTSRLRQTLVGDLNRGRCAEDFARLTARCETDPTVSATALRRCHYRVALIAACKGGAMGDITPGDVLELLDIEAGILGTGIGGTRLFYRMLHELGVFGSDVPTTLRELRSPGQRSPAQLIDRYRLQCTPIRDLLVEYLTERQPALDYATLCGLATSLGKLFWADLERHNPGICSLRLPVEVADAWKKRFATVTVTTRGADGAVVETTTERRNYHGCLTQVRAFYLDLAQWALEEPARWGPWVAPCPIRSGELDRRKAKRRLKSRMDSRTRARLPMLPELVRHVDRRRKNAAELLQAAQAVAPGSSFSAAGTTLVRSHTKESTPHKVWAHHPDTGHRVDVKREESHAFWTWAVVEVLRATGVRIEELLEITHHSLVQYRLPSTGELVPLLQIAPSKTDSERLLLVNPELADVLATILRRIRDDTGAVPFVAAFDPHERTWHPPAPFLFQRRVGTENQAISARAVRDLLTKAITTAGFTDQSTGGPLHFNPHDFRRMFITDAVLNGLPPHIAQVIAGHRDINVTMGYKAVYPDEAIQAHLGFLARRRALRPTEEYRTPTDDEWAEFLGHFERRKVSTGTCGRAFGTPCIHEHACIRCSMLWPDPSQRDRLVEIRDNLRDRITEAEHEGWLGEIEGLRISLHGAEDKLTQIDRRPRTTCPVELGTPTPLTGHGSTCARTESPRTISPTLC